MKHKQDASFLERWSRKKRGLETEDDVPSDDRGEGASESGEVAARREDPDEVATESVAKKDFADFDFDKLDYESDYTQFMGDDVTQEARHRALRKLWVSNPVLANMDGLDDYCEDYTDAAVCLPKGVLKTAYQFGRGFLSDEEVAEWEKLGKPSGPEVAAEDAARDDASTQAGDEVDVAQGSPDAVPEADTGPGAACAVSVKQDEEKMLAEFEDDEASSKSSGT